MLFEMFLSRLLLCFWGPVNLCLSLLWVVIQLKFSQYPWDSILFSSLSFYFPTLLLHTFCFLQRQNTSSSVKESKCLDQFKNVGTILYHVCTFARKFMILALLSWVFFSCHISLLLHPYTSKVSHKVCLCIFVIAFLASVW